MTTTKALGKKVTPTGHLVLSCDAPRSEWLKERRRGITATDVATIMGSPYRTAIDVWTDKVMEPLENEEEREVGEAAIWGQHLEDPVAKEWAKRHGLKLRRVGLIQHHAELFMMASLDRLVLGCPEGRCALEVKTRSAYSADAWDDGVPDDVLHQVHWQMLVAGFTHIHVAALIGGQRLIERTVYWNLGVAKKIIEAAVLVWNAVHAGTPPDLPQTLWSDNYLEQRHPDRAGDIEIEDANFLCHEYENLSEEIKALKDRQALLKTQLVGLLGDAEIGLFEGRPFYSYKPTTRRTINAKELEKLYPNIISDPRIWNTSTTRTLRIINTKEKK